MMQEEGVFLESLIFEYGEILQQFEQVEAAQVEENLRLVVDALCRCSDWTEQGANAITRLATDYGAFMLGNALAIAVVLGKEDGELGF